MMEINSLNNQLVKETVALRKNRVRVAKNLIIVEGKKEIKMALSAGFNLNKLFICPELLKDSGDIKEIQGKEEYRVNLAVMKKIAYRENPDPWLALFVAKNYNFSDIEFKKEPLLVVIEKLEKPGNLGAILRSANASAVDAIIVNDMHTDIYNPNVVRSSLGAVFTLPVICSDIDKTLVWLKSQKIVSFAATPGATKNYTKMNFKKASALIIGAEHEGLSGQWLEASDERIKIPMHGEVDSLNASVSTAIILFEIQRQRSAS